MNRLILLFLFFQGMSFIACKTTETSVKSGKLEESSHVSNRNELKDISASNEGEKPKSKNVIEYELLGTNYYSSNPYAEGIYIARSFEDAIAITEGDSRLEDVLSKINFEKEALIFVFAGTFNTGGYSINVDSIKRIGKNKISAVFSISSPSPDSIVTQALTHPSIIVSLKVSKTDIIQASFR